MDICEDNIFMLKAERFGYTATRAIHIYKQEALGER